MQAIISPPDFFFFFFRFPTDLFVTRDRIRDVHIELYIVRRVSGLHVDYLRTEEEDGKTEQEEKKSRDISVTTLMIQP